MSFPWNGLWKIMYKVIHLKKTDVKTIEKWSSNLRKKLFFVKMGIMVHYYWKLDVKKINDLRLLELKIIIREFFLKKFLFFLNSHDGLVLSHACRKTLESYKNREQQKWFINISSTGNLFEYWRRKIIYNLKPIIAICIELK